MQYWMYAATGEPNVKWGGTDFKWGGREPLAPPLATALAHPLATCQLCHCIHPHVKKAEKIGKVITRRVVNKQRK